MPTDEIKALEARLTLKIMNEVAKEKNGLLDLIAARTVVVKAMLEELDEAQRERVKSRALELAGSKQVAEYVGKSFSPSEPD